MKESTLCEKIERNIMYGVQSGLLDNKDLIKIIQTSGVYLNLTTISNYSKQNNISYNGAKNNREVINMFGVKFIVDNL
jgi:hypothetical protein